MPYNTRRKSLSLPSLGIHLPSSSRRSPSISKSHDDQPSKKVKRSHDSLSISPEPQLAPQHHLHHQQHHRPSARRAAWEHTPPPPPLHGHGGSDGDNSSLSPVPPKIDTEGINDDIVVAVIRQLEATHNRPHLVKELAAVLVSLNDTVANSANPAALLSSRLSSYMKRSWSALAPCPIGKELILIHPRKVYYYLTTMTRQPLPENSDDLVIPGQQISPPATLDKRGGQQSTQDHDNAEDEEEEEEEEDDDDDNDAVSFRQRSSSPEVDLSSPDFEEDEHNINSLTGRPGATRTTHGFDDPHSSSMRMMHSHRAVSPPLEGDEKEFTQTASAVRERASEQQKASQQLELSNARSAISEGLSQLDMHDSSSASSAVSSSASSSRSSSSAAAAGANNNNNSTNNYNNSYDYFAHNDEHHHHHKIHEQLVEHDSDAAACALLGTSPSPSLTSVASSLSSSAPSVAGLDSEEERAPRISLPEDPSVTHVSPLKRSIDMLNSGLSDADIDINMADLADHEDKVAIKTAAAPASAATIGTMNVDHSYDSSWRELQNPETVEVDELDEMFGEI